MGNPQTSTQFDFSKFDKVDNFRQDLTEGEFDFSGFDREKKEQFDFSAFDKTAKVFDFGQFDEDSPIKEFLTKVGDFERTGVADLAGLNVEATKINLQLTPAVAATTLGGVPAASRPDVLSSTTITPSDGRGSVENAKQGVVNVVGALVGAMEALPLFDPQRPLRKAFIPKIVEFEDAQRAALAQSIRNFAERTINVAPETGVLAKPVENFLDYFKPDRIQKTILEEGPLMGVLMATTMLNPLMGSVLIAGVEGGSTVQALKELEVQGNQIDPFYKDIAPVIVGSVNATLERTGFGAILRTAKVSGLVKRFLSTLTSALVEGGTEGLQEVNQILAEAGAGRRITLEDWDRVKASVAGGIILGTSGSVVVGGVGGVKEVRDKVKENVEAEKVAFELKKEVISSELAGRRIAEIRGDELGVSRENEERIVVGDGKITRTAFAKLAETERRVIREAEMDALPPTIQTIGREKGEVEQDIKVKFIDESIVEANRPVEQYEMEIGGVKTDFFVSRIQGQTLRDSISENIRLYVDPMHPADVQETAARALKEKNFGLQRQLTERYHEWVRGEVKEKLKKQFKGSAVVDDEGNPIRVYHGTKNVFKEFRVSKQSPAALFGPGFYFTENPDVAGGYAPSERDIFKNVQGEDFTEVGPPSNIRVAFLKLKNLFDVEKNFTEKEATKLFSDFLDGLSKISSKVRNPVTELSKIKSMQRLRELINRGQGNISGEELYSILTRNVPITKEGETVFGSSKSVVNDILSDMGFDGIKHIGGQITGGVKHQVWITFEKDQIVENFETYAKHQQKLTKNNPPPPNLEARDLTFQEIIELLPRRLGGKWPDDKPIVDVFAEQQGLEGLSEEALRKEEALNKVLPNIKTWNEFVSNYEDVKPLIDKRSRKKEKELNKLKVWVADTGLLFADNLGAAGGKVMQLGIDGFNTTFRLHRIASTFRQKVQKLIDHSNWTEPISYNKQVKIVSALQDRENAKQHLSDVDGILDETSFEIFELLQADYDIFENELAQRGIKTEEDYFTRVAIRTSGLDQVIFNVQKDIVVSTQDTLSGKVQSKFLVQRTGELEKIRYDLLEVFDLYHSSVIKSLAYRDVVDYYSNNFIRSEEGTFGADIPTELVNSKKFPGIRKEVNSWIRGLVEPDRMTGPVGKFIMKVRRTTYATFLRLNPKAALDNSTQDMFIQAFVPKEVWGIYRGVYRDRKRFKDEAPNLAEAMDKASRDKTYLMEMTEGDLGQFGTEKDGFVRHAWTKLGELDPFFMAERANWTKAEVAGLTEYAWKKEEWGSVLAKHNGDAMLAVDEIIGADSINARESVIQARQLSWQTQLMAGNVAAPHIFRTELGKIIGMFKRFPFGQMENIVRSFQQSGTSGIAALRILARGFPDEVQHVETLRSIEVLRKGVEEVEKLGREFPELEINMGAVTSLRSTVSAQEKELDGIVKRIQPINKNNKSAQVKLWSHYAAKRLVYAYTFNVLSILALDALGLGDDDEIKGDDPFKRASDSAFRNLVPFYWDIRDPSALFSPAILPDVGGQFGGGRQRLRGWIRWGFNSVPYAGVLDRITGRRASDWLVDQIIPKKVKSFF